MPHILVSSKPNFSPFSAGPSGWPRLAELLQRLAVKYLAVEDPGGDLFEDDIDVTFTEPGQYDRQKKDVVITIKANYFATRARQRTERLASFKEEALASGAFHRDTTVGFWLLLPLSAWEEV